MRAKAVVATLATLLAAGCLAPPDERQAAAGGELVLPLSTIPEGAEWAVVRFEVPGWAAAAGYGTVSWPVVELVEPQGHPLGRCAAIATRSGMMSVTLEAPAPRLHVRADDHVFSAWPEVAGLRSSTDVGAINEWQEPFAIVLMGVAERARFQEKGGDMNVSIQFYDDAGRKIAPTSYRVVASGNASCLAHPAQFDAARWHGTHWAGQPSGTLDIEMARARLGPDGPGLVFLRFDAPSGGTFALDCGGDLKVLHEGAGGMDGFAYLGPEDSLVIAQLQGSSWYDPQGPGAAWFVLHGLDPGWLEGRPSHEAEDCRFR